MSEFTKDFKTLVVHRNGGLSYTYNTIEEWRDRIGDNDIALDVIDLTSSADLRRKLEVIYNLNELLNNEALTVKELFDFLMQWQEQCRRGSDLQSTVLALMGVAFRRGQDRAKGKLPVK